MLPRQLKDKRCKSCGVTFAPHKAMQKVCSIPCSLDLGRKLAREKLALARRKRDAKWKVDNRTTSDWTKLVQVEFNKFIRTRDEQGGLPCVSCGTHTPKHSGRGGLWDAGHYLSRGSHPELKFSEDNCHRQCKKCNTRGFSSQRYRDEIINRIGLARVEALEGPHPPKQYRREQLEGMLAEYKAKNKALLVSI